MENNCILRNVSTEDSEDLTLSETSRGQTRGNPIDHIRGLCGRTYSSCCAFNQRRLVAVSFGIAQNELRKGNVRDADFWKWSTVYHVIYLSTVSRYDQTIHEISRNFFVFFSVITWIVSFDQADFETRTQLKFWQCSLAIEEPGFEIIKMQILLELWRWTRTGNSTLQLLRPASTTRPRPARQARLISS